MNSVKEQIEKITEEMAKDGGQVIGNPKSMDELRAMGIDVPNFSRVVSFEEYVDSIFSENNKKKVVEKLKTLPAPPNIPVPAIVGIYKEILKCITLDINGAAITLSCVLVEYILKFAAYKVEVGGFKRYDAAKLDEFEKLEFGNAVGRAAKNGLLSKQERKELNEFRDRIRNPYLHYNLKKITSKVYIKGLKILNTKTGTIEEKDVRAIDDQVIQAQAKPFADENQVNEVFVFVNRIVHSVWAKIEHLQHVPAPNDEVHKGDSTSQRS